MCDDKDKQIAKLIRQNKELDCFARVVAHDLRNPNATAYGYFEYIRDLIIHKVDSDTIEIYDRIGKSLMGSLDLIDALLQCARAGKTDIMPVKLKLVDIVQDAKEYLDVKISTTKAKVAINIPTTLIVMGNKQLLSIVFTNLIDNALKYVAVGVPPVIEIQAKIKDEHILITITDKGIGIPIGKIDTIFKEFERISEHTKIASGSGIGLSTVKRIVESHGGKISAQSVINNGTIFTITYPLVKK